MAEKQGAVRWAFRLIRRAAPRLLLALVVLTLLQGVFPTGLALALRGLIDAALLASREGGPGAVETLIPWLALAFALAAGDTLSALAAVYVRNRLTDELQVRVTSEILEHAWSLDFAFFEDPARQDLLARTQSNMAVHLEAFASEVLSVCRNVVTAAGLLAVLVSIEPLVLAVVAPFALPLFLFQWRLARQRYSEEHRRATKRRWTAYFLSKLTASASLAEVRVLDLGPLLIRKFGDLQREFRDRDRALHFRSFRGTSIAALLAIAALYALFVRVAYRAVTGSVTLGNLAIYGGAAVRMRQAVNEAIRAFAASRERLLHVANLRDFLSQEPPASREVGLTPALDRGEIEIRDLSFTYPGSPEPVLRDLSLSIRPGETLALVGDNGAGKSTLVKLLARLYDPDGGRITFDGVDLRTIAPAHLQRRIGFVLQSYGRYEATVAENIAFGDWPRLLDDRDAVERLAGAVGLHERIESLEAKYATHLGRTFGANDLSVGEWQKIAIARALARPVSLLVLDEPTASLDARTEYELFNRFKALAEGRTTLLISHRFTTIGMADRIAVLAGGRVVETGSHDELIDRRGAYAALFELYESLLPAAGSGKRAARDIDAAGPERTG